MSRADVNLPQRKNVSGFGVTERTDRWYIQPLLVLFGLSAFVIYATWAAFQAEHNLVHAGGAHYLSPFY